MKKHLLMLLIAVPLAAQPVLYTQPADGVERAQLLHASTGDFVTAANPALPGENLIALTSGVESLTTVHIGDTTVDGLITDSGNVNFVMPTITGGGFVEISLETTSARSNVASFVVAAASDGVQLTAAEVQSLAINAALAIDAPTLVAAVVDRAGNPLAIYARPSASSGDIETALSLARTGAFFSNSQAPLSSRTVRYISTENFPEGIPNQPAAALFGIENTNRGCTLSTGYLPGQAVPPARNATGTGPSTGITTIPGGVPLYRNGGVVIGGIAVAGVDPSAAEFAVVAATFGTPFFIALPLPSPGAVFIDGFRLPFVNQTTRPAGTSAAAAPGGAFLTGPLDGQAIQEGWLVGPKPGSALSQDEVRSIVDAAIARANRTRAQIRLPLGSRTKMVISVADLDGTILALYRMPDATVFSIDVAATKARNVVYFSGGAVDPADLPGIPPGTAVTNRTIGFGSQSMFPSGIRNSTPGPFRNLFLFDRANPCTQGRQPANANQSGIVFFPGSSALYKGGRMVGGLGVSGDGVEQDDYVTAGGAQGFEAPDSTRADQLFIRNVRLPYWKFPRNPEQ
jgi:uncharacterized protein GlcG (DUF336 family)